MTFFSLKNLKKLKRTTHTVGVLLMLLTCNSAILLTGMPLVTVDELKERWRYMRDRYVKEIGGRKYQGSVPLLDCKTEGSFVNLMSFLNPFIKRKSW